MAVYINLIKKILKIYYLIILLNLSLFHGIKEGIENTNYFLKVNNTKYIPTYEKRVLEQDLPFFLILCWKLNDAKFKCPVPILMIIKFISKYKEKLMITSFLEGKAKEILTPNNCVK